MSESENEKTTELPSKKSRHRKKKLFKMILQQMEFYFSDSNLTKDRFLGQLIAEDPYVDLEIFLKFNKIRKLNCTLEDIQNAIKRSELIQLSEDCKRVCRKVAIKTKENEDECTVYVENIPSDCDHDWLKQIFSEFGQTVYISIPKYKHNKVNKGFAFVEFDNESEAKAALDAFENVGCKMSLDKDPEELRSIATFEGDGNVKNSQDLVDNEASSQKEDKRDQNGKEEIKMELTDTQDKDSKKRKLESDEEENQQKKTKTDSCENGAETKPVEGEIDGNKALDVSADSKLEEDSGKKKKKKKDKKKNYLKELGLQVLSKKEWKKIRNRYLDLQKKKMKEYKQYLHRQKFSKCSYGTPEHAEDSESTKQNKKAPEETVNTKLEFTPGVIVKVQLTEPCLEAKKLKTEIQSSCANVKYVDIPTQCGSEEVFVRFGDSESAKEFCDSSFAGSKTLLEGEEETSYWQKMENDRKKKFSKEAKKQRGRDKLLKKAEKERAKHMRFEENETIS